MINWSKYFDKIICINYSQYKIRRELIQFQLKRVGILDSPNFEWEITFRGPYEKILKQMLDPENKTFSDATFSCIIGHLNAIKKAYFTGCKNVLIIEDDARFLRNLDKIQQILQNKPSEDQFDVILYDKFVSDKTGGPWKWSAIVNNKSNYLNDDYLKTDAFLLSAGCYCLSRQGMQLILDQVDKENITTVDYYLNYFIKDIRKVCTPKPIAVQVIFKSAQNFVRCRSNDTLHRLGFHLNYKYQGITFDDYMMRKDGSKYDWGDYIKE